MFCEEGPFRTYPELVCNLPFQRSELRKYSLVGLLTSVQRLLSNAPESGLVNQAAMFCPTGASVGRKPLPSGRGD